ncbi:MAG: slipin family protein [Alphaproteobacteria bacterium]|nr:slipin family protein [Alphaproteobacteria bacterium]
MIQIFIILLFFLAMFVVTSVRIMKEYERAVIFTLGRYTHTAGPGLIVLIPFLQNMVRVDIRVRTTDVPPQDVISKDNVSVRVSAVIYYRVVDPSSAIVKVEDFMQATSEISQTTLRSVLGHHELDNMLSNRDQLNKDIQELLDTATEGWGVKITGVAIKQIDLDPSMVRAIARQAEAERERRAKIINAEGELQAAKQLDEAATILAQRPETMQLRYLSALTDIAGDKTNTIVMPVPDLLSTIMAAGKK